MERVRVAFDAQLLLEPQRTGIGTMAYQTLLALADEPAVDGVLNLFTMRKKRGYEKQFEQIELLHRRGFLLKTCAWFHDVLYKMLWNFIPIPYRLFFGKNTDITHFFNYYVPPGVAGKRVTTVCDMVYEAYPETMNKKTRCMLRLSMKRSIRRAHHIVTISEFSKGQIMEYLGVEDERITVVPCGVDHTAFHPDIPDPSRRAVRAKFGLDDRYFLYLGTLEPRKNLVRLVEAYAQLVRMRSGVPTLCIAGRKGWQFRDIFEAVRNNELEDKVVFTGYVDEADAPALMAEALAFVFPSLYEGFGLPPLEAMACGTPVIVSGTGSLPEVVGDAGVLVDPRDAYAIARAMENMMDDAAMRERYSKQGLARAAGYTWENAAAALVGMYRRLMREG